MIGASFERLTCLSRIVSTGLSLLIEYGISASSIQHLQVQDLPYRLSLPESLVTARLAATRWRLFAYAAMLNTSPRDTGQHGRSEGHDAR